VKTSAVGVTITIPGTSITVTVSPGGAFTLNGVPSGTIQLHFTGTGIDATATISNVADNETIHIVVNVNGSQANVTITDREGPKPNASSTELEGLISAINTAARTIVVNGVTVSVPTTATIRHGDTNLSLANLAVGQRVHVKGTLSGSTVVATEVMLQNDNEKNDEAEAEGTVSARSGTCPAITFMLGTTKVTTNGSTQFKGATCAQIANGTKAEVSGTRQTDGSIVATKVNVDSEKEDSSAVNG